MSTRSDISILNPNGSVQTQYIHMDGYLAGNGQILLDNYKTMQEAKKILDLGAYHADSSLPETPKVLEDTISFKTKDETSPEYHLNLDSFKDDLVKYDEYADGSKHLDRDTEYHYLYAPDAKGKYQWHTINRDGIKPLTQKAIDTEKMQEAGTYNSASWARDEAGEWSAPLTKTEMTGLNQGISQIKQNLTTFDQRELKQAEKVFSSNKLSASWYLQKNRVEEEKLDSADSNGFKEEQPERDKLTTLEKKLTPKQINYFNQLYEITRDKSLSGNNKSRLSQVAEQKIIARGRNITTREKVKEGTKEAPKKHKFDREAWKKQHEQTVEQMKNGLLKEVEQYTQTPEQMLELLKFTDKFHQYSARNAMLIHLQRPSAGVVGSYKKYKDMGYSVKKGEKGIKMFVPTKATTFYRKGKDGKDVLTQLKNATKAEKEKLKTGQIPSYEKTFYKIGTVFDATQTDMPKEKYPELYPNRHQDFDMKNPEQLKDLEKGLKKVAKDMGMPVITYSHDLKDIDDPQNAKGYFNVKTKQIVLNQYNTPTENVTVLAHELGHAQLHNNQKQEKKLPREIKEMQAELTSYLYSSHYGIDTKKEAVSYIADWTENGKKFNELPTGVKGQVLTHVSSATKVLTKATDKVLEQQKERSKMRTVEHSKVKEEPKQTKAEPAEEAKKREQYKRYLAQRGLNR